MSYGFEITNNSGSLLIDGETSNYTLLLRGFANTNETVWLPVNSLSRPLVFVRFNSSSYFVRLSVLTNDAIAFQMWNAPNSSTDAQQVAGTVEYMVFALARAQAPTSGYGVHVFNASGQLVFDSNRQVPRVRQVVTVPALPIFSDGDRHPNNVVGHSQGVNPWMLANFTYNVYGYSFIQEYAQPTSDLMVPAIRSDNLNGNRIVVQAVKRGTQIGSQGSAWSYAPMPVPLIP